MLATHVPSLGPNTPYRYQPRPTRSSFLSVSVCAVVHTFCCPQPAKMAVTVRDGSGTPILPVIEHFGGPTAEEEESGEEGASRRSRRAAGFPPDAAGAAAATGGERERRTRGEGRERRPAVERTFLDRSPPPECVEAVLPGGCTARKVTAFGACLFVLVRNGWLGQGLVAADGGLLVGPGLFPVRDTHTHTPCCFLEAEGRTLV